MKLLIHLVWATYKIFNPINYTVSSKNVKQRGMRCDDFYIKEKIAVVSADVISRPRK